MVVGGGGVVVFVGGGGVVVFVGGGGGVVFCLLLLFLFLLFGGCSCCLCGVGVVFVGVFQCCILSFLRIFLINSPFRQNQKHPIKPKEKNYMNTYIFLRNIF